VLFRRTRCERAAASLEAIAERLQWWAELFESSVRRLCGVAREIANLRQPARISFWSAISSGPIRGAAAALLDAETGDQTGADRDVRKSQSRTGIAPEMKILRPISILLSLPDIDGERGGASLVTPPGVDTPPAADKPAAKPKAKPPVQAKKPPLPPRQRSPRHLAAAPAAAATPAPVPDDPNADLVYGAYQRGQYKTAFDLASKRAQDFSDPKAMTMLGELYANAMGVKRDYAKAADWYSAPLTAATAEGMFALAMLRLGGRGGPVNREEAVKLLASSAKLGNPKAAYNLALLYPTGRRCRRISNAPRNCFASPPTPAIRKRNTRWRPSTRRAPAFRKTSTGGAAVTGGVARRQCRRRGSNTPLRSITVPHAEERGRRGGAVAQGRQTKQSDRTEPPRSCIVERTGRNDGQGRGDEMAHYCGKPPARVTHARRGPGDLESGGSCQGPGGRADLARQKMIRLTQARPQGTQQGARTARVASGLRPTALMMRASRHSLFLT